MQNFSTNGITSANLKILLKTKNDLYKKYGFFECIPLKIIGHKHILFSTAYVQLHPYEIMAANQGNCSLIYEQEEFTSMLNQLALSEIIPIYEKHFQTAVIHHCRTNFELIEDRAERTIVVCFDKKIFEYQPSKAWQEIEDKLIFALSKELRLHTSKGPQKCRVNVLDEKMIVYELIGWLSLAEQNYLMKKTATSGFQTTLQAIITDVVLKVEQLLMGNTLKIHVAFSPSNNHIMIYTLR